MCACVVCSLLLRVGSLGVYSPLLQNHPTGVDIAIYFLFFSWLEFYFFLFCKFFFFCFYHSIVYMFFFCILFFCISCFCCFALSFLQVFMYVLCLNTLICPLIRFLRRFWVYGR